MEKLGSRIKRLRKEKGVKQSFLHDNQSAVSHLSKEVLMRILVLNFYEKLQRI